MDERGLSNSTQGPQARGRGQSWRTTAGAAAIPQGSSGTSFGAVRSVVAAIVRHRHAWYHSSNRYSAKRDARRATRTAFWNRFAALFLTNGSPSGIALCSFRACLGLGLVSNLFPSFSKRRDVAEASRYYCSGVLPHLLPITGVSARVRSCLTGSEGDVKRKSDADYYLFCRESD